MHQLATLPSCFSYLLNSYTWAF